MTTGSSSAKDQPGGPSPVGFWITLVRGMMAVTLGLALLVQPDKTRPLLLTFMGMFWLVSGILSIRWGISGQRARGLPLLAGIVGVLAGLAALAWRFRPFSAYVDVSEAVLVSLLGVIILLTGVIHILGGFRTGEEASRERSWTSFLLGVFEVVLGAMLVVEPLEPGVWIHVTASIWALLGGFILIGDALRLRAQARRAQASPIAVDPDEGGQ